MPRIDGPFARFLVAKSVIVPANTSTIELNKIIVVSSSAIIPCVALVHCPVPLDFAPHSVSYASISVLNQPSRSRYLYLKNVKPSIDDGRNCYLLRRLADDG